MTRKLLSSLLIASSLLCAGPAFAEPAFTPLDASTVSINVSASSQAVQVTTFGGGQQVRLSGSFSNAQQVRVVNAGTAMVWIRAGCVGVTATTSDIPEPAGAVEVLTLNTGSCALYVAAIAAGSTGSVYFTPGAGI